MTSPDTPDPAEPGSSASGRGAEGLRSVLVATVVAGALGYVIQGLVAGAITADSYLGFSMFWSAVYLTIAALSGLQQEATRAAHPIRAGQQPSTVVGFAVVIAGIVAMIVVATSPLWGGAVFPHDTAINVFLLAVGAVSYIGVALLSGLFYGLRLWFAVAGMTIVDTAIRLVLVGIALLAGGHPLVLAAAVVAPFPLALATLWLTQRRHVGGRYVLDVTPSTLSWNALRAVGGSISTGILTSGFPLLIGATSRGEPEGVVGALVFVVTLTRAPLVVPALALQSYLTVTFRDKPQGRIRLLVILLTMLMAVSVVLAAAAYAIEPWLLEAIWGPAYVVSAWTAAGIVATAGLTAALCVSGPAALAAGRHGTYFAGWAVAAVLTVVVIFLPLPLEVRTVAAMGVGPVLGVLVHVVGLTIGPHTPAEASAPARP